MTQRAVPGLRAKATSPEAPLTREIRGSTTIVELLRMFPAGEAAALMARLQLPCAHCGGAFLGPLTWQQAPPPRPAGDDRPSARWKREPGDGREAALRQCREAVGRLTP
jgi:hypothetical protein